MQYFTSQLKVRPDLELNLSKNYKYLEYHIYEKSLKRVKKVLKLGFRTRVIIKAFSPFRPTTIELILVMLPGSALAEKLLT